MTWAAIQSDAPTIVQAARRGMGGAISATDARAALAWCAWLHGQSRAQYRFLVRDLAAGTAWLVVRDGAVRVLTEVMA